MGSISESQEKMCLYLNHPRGTLVKAVYLALSGGSVGYLSGTFKAYFQKRLNHDSYTDTNEH